MLKLQLFAEEGTATTTTTKPEVVQGKKIVYLFRLLSEAGTKNATAMAFVTENERSKSKDYESTATKDGSVMTPGEAEQEITATAIFSTDDSAEKFEDAMDNDSLIEIWEANLAAPIGTTTGQFKGRYFQGYLKEFTLTSSAEEHAEYETTFGINGKGVKGNVTVTKDQQAMAEYAFADTTAKSGT